MQSVTDRDKYVEIKWENIRDCEHIHYIWGKMETEVVCRIGSLLAHRKNFNAYPTKEVISFGLPYDYDSVMHYGTAAFGNGLRTIVPKVKLHI